jgi:hypothetical protein
MSEHSAENDAAPVVQWAHVLDEAGSADLYDTEAEAREMLALVGGGLDRIETTTVVSFHVIPPAEKGQADA